MTKTVTDSDLARTQEWFETAIPEPGKKNFSTQLGVHLEEIGEMFTQLSSDDTEIRQRMRFLEGFLTGFALVLKKTDAEIIVTDEKEFCDALNDQIVTAVGTGYMRGYDMPGSHGEVNRSNFSKFDENGNPILDSNKKIQKGLNYFKPNLTPYLNRSTENVQ